MDNTTLNYYNTNAQDFVQGTVDVDFHITQDRFLAQLEKVRAFWTLAVAVAGTPSTF